MKKHMSLLLAVIMVLSMLLTACGNTAEEAPAPAPAEENAAAPAEEAEAPAEAPEEEPAEDRMEKPGDADTVFVGVAGQAQGNLDPLSSRCTIAIYMAYDTLLGYNQNTDEYSMLIAESMERTDDGFLHIKIRDEAAFASGESITAEDVLYAFERCFKSGTSTYVNSTVDLENSYAEGEKDVYIALLEDDMSLEGCISHMMLVVENKSWVETATDEDYWDNVDYSGPYSVVENVNGSHILFQVRDDYWGWGVVAERPNYDYLKVTFYSEASTMLVDYESGMLDVVGGLSASDTARILEDGMEHSTLRIQPDSNMYGLVLCPYVEAFADPTVREAIISAIDVDAVVSAAYGALGTTANAYAPLGAQYRVEYGDVAVNNYDPDHARQLLADAGYADGDIVVKIVTTNDAGNITMAEIVQAYLADVGITLNIESYEPSVAIPMFRNGETDLVFNQYAMYNKYMSGVWITTGLDSTNKSITMPDEELDGHIREGRFAADTATAQEHYEWIQNWFHESNYMLPMADTNTAIMYRDYVDADNVFSPFTWSDMRNINLF